MWDLPGSGLKPVSPALAGGFLTTVPPGKSPSLHLKQLAIQPLPTLLGTWSLCPPPRVEVLGLGALKPARLKSESCLPNFLAVLPWSSHLTFPHLHYLICKMGENNLLGKFSKTVHLKFLEPRLSARVTHQLHPPPLSSRLTPCLLLFPDYWHLSGAFGEMITKSQ